MRPYYITLLVLTGIILCSGCAPAPRFREGPIGKTEVSGKQPSKFKVGQRWRGKCSYYAEEFNGRKTSSGEIFDMNALTAAHLKLPFGTIVRVINLKNNK